MASVNVVIILGHVGQGVELKYTERGKPFCQFTVATNAEWTDAAGVARKEVEWHRIVTWDKLADTCGKFLAVGKLVYIEGRKTEQRWTDQTGKEQRRCQILAHRVQFLYQTEQAPQSQHGEDPRIYRDVAEEASFKHRNA